MELFNLKYSEKNIPLPTHREYTKRLLEKVESIIKRMRWKAFFFLNKDSDTDSTSETDSTSSEDDVNHQYYGFKSKRTPPPIEGMAGFEKDMIQMVEDLEFRQVREQFQNNLKEDVNKINSSDKVFVSADKTRNIYKMESGDYNKLLNENITQTYKAAKPDVIRDINNNFDKITEELNISDRISETVKKPAFVTIKDHKDNFLTKPSCRLINPAKTETGKVSKQFLDRINKDIRSKLKVNQWRNTASVIEWFGKLQEKHKLKFLMFDMVNFYPSITEKLLTKCLKWAKEYTNISDIEYRTIMHSRRSLLFDHNGNEWVKKNAENEFDVSMGAFDGAEVCELVGLYVLHLIKTKLRMTNVGLYRDDGLAVLKSKSGSEADRIRKNLIKMLKSLGLQITVELNLKTVNFLDINLSLETGLCRPYRKPNDNPVYINRESNHPPSIIKRIPESIGKRISSISSNEQVFRSAAHLYDEALRSSGYKEKIAYTESKEKKKRKNRSRKIIWFNPPFSKDVKTNVGRAFRSSVDKHFPRSHKLHKIFNKNTLKISYSTMNNMKSIIQAHNSQVMKKSNPKPTERECNCINKTNCPLRGKCLTSAIVYKATVTVESDDKTYVYIGLTGGQFKFRFNNHTSSFKNKAYEKDTALSKLVWELKRKKQAFSINWSIIKKSNTIKRDSGQCNLCMEEKVEILSMKSGLLNKRGEIISKCRHNKKPPNRGKKKK